MIDWAISLLANKVGIEIGQLLMWIISINLFFGGARSALEFISSKTETKADDKALGYLNKASKIMAKIIDFLSANKEHKK